MKTGCFRSRFFLYIFAILKLNTEKMAFNINDNAKCGVIGYGSWATALVHTLVKNKVHVWWHIRNEEVMESLLTEGINAKYLSDIEFDQNYISPVSDINEVVRNTEVILIATPSAFLKNVTITQQLPIRITP